LAAAAVCASRVALLVLDVAAVVAVVAMLVVL
jgi:hypothetical protein